LDQRFRKSTHYIYTPICYFKNTIYHLSQLRNSDSLDQRFKSVSNSSVIFFDEYSTSVFRKLAIDTNCFFIVLPADHDKPHLGNPIPWVEHDVSIFFGLLARDANKLNCVRNLTRSF
jgi:hypothetical protein